MQLVLDIMLSVIGQRLTNSMGSVKLYQSEAWLRKRYHVDRKTPEQIAKECNASVETIYLYLKKFKLKKTGR
jgi:hypothetical protein